MEDVFDAVCGGDRLGDCFWRALWMCRCEADPGFRC